MITRRGRGAALLAALATAMVSACTTLLGLEPGTRTGPCTSDIDCPASELCIDKTCRDVCSSSTDCAAPLMCARVATALACVPPATADAMAAPTAETEDASVGAPAVDPSAEAATPGTEAALADAAPGAADSAGDVAADLVCPPCDAPFSTCVEGSCRALSWVTPEVTYSTPAPAAPVATRHYYHVIQRTIYAQRIHVARDGWLVRVGFLASTAQPATTYRIALYDDTLGFPLHLVTNVGPDVTLSGADDGRQESNVSPLQRIAAGSYWIALMTDGIDLAYQSSGNPVATAHATAEDARFPDPFPSNQATPTPYEALSIYAVVANDPF